jgi:hypothetical protein
LLIKKALIVTAAFSGKHCYFLQVALIRPPRRRPEDSIRAYRLVILMLYNGTTFIRPRVNLEH